MDEFENPTVNEEEGKGSESYGSAAESEITGGGQEGVVGSSQDEVHSGVSSPAGGGDGRGLDRDTGEGAGAQAPDAGGAGRQKAEQDRRTNALMAATRRRAEQETRQRVERERDRSIAEMRIPNPYKPGTFFGSLKEMQDYSEALRRADAEKRAKASNRDVEEVMAEDEERAFVRRQMAESRARNDEKQRQRSQRDFIARDLADFQGRHPDVDIAALDGNAAFRRFAGTRYGREKLADLYEDFIAITGQAQTAGAAKSKGKADRGTGSGEGGSPATVLTAQQRADLKAWNENFPHMKMSEKEFLSQQ